jgi:hypothetical protein
MARRPKPSTADYFLKRVLHETKTPDECWDWQGPVNYAGYGRLLWNGQRVMAHRVMAALTEKIPDIDAPEFVSQSCNNRRCCNPKHLVIK